MHGLLLVELLLAFALVPVFAALQLPHLAGLSGLAVVFVLVTLHSVDDIYQRAVIAREMRAVKSQILKILSERKILERREHVHDNVAVVWLGRTIHLLQILKELVLHLQDTPNPLKGRFLHSVTAGYAVLLDHCGPLNLWVGDKQLPEAERGIAQEQLRKAQEKISQVGAQEQIVCDVLRNVFGCLFVKCKAVRKLDELVFGTKLPSPYVKVLVGRQDHYSAVKSTIKKNTVNPRWGKEEESGLMFVCKQEDVDLQLQVWDANTNKALGFDHEDFKEFTPGVWHERVKNLRSLRSSSGRFDPVYDAVVEYEFFFANSVKLLDKEALNSEHARASRKLRLSAFLSS